MKPCDVFGICVRLIGLLGLLLAGAYMVSALICLSGLRAEYGQAYTGEYVLWAIVDGAVSLYLLRGAPGIVDFAYPQTRAEEDLADNTSQFDS